MSGCFRCHLCGKICLFTIDAVHGHLTRVHKMNWGAYKLQYLSSGLQAEVENHNTGTSSGITGANISSMMDQQVQVS